MRDKGQQFATKIKMLFHLYETSNSIWDFGKSSEHLSYFNKI